MIPSFSAIESFFWAANLLSFRRAAEILNVTQPAISYRIRELEGGLGVQLFSRAGRGVQLTSDGAALFAYAERMMSIARDVESNISVRRQTTQPIKLGVIDSFTSICMPQLLARLDKGLPNLRVSITIDNSHALASRVSQGTLDAAVLSTPPMLPGMELEQLGVQAVGWFASPELKLKSSTLSFTRLTKFRIFSTPAPSNLYFLILRSAGIDPNAHLLFSECNSLAVILRIIEDGLGVGILPKRMVETQCRTGLIEEIFPEKVEIPPQEIFVAYNKGSLNRSLRVTFTAIKELVQESNFCQTV